MLNKSISEIFSPLYQLFQNYKVDSPDRFANISLKNRKALSGRIALFFTGALPDILRIVEMSQGIVLNFDNYSPRWAKTEKVGPSLSTSVLPLRSEM